MLLPDTSASLSKSTRSNLSVYRSPRGVGGSKVALFNSELQKSRNAKFAFFLRGGVGKVALFTSELLKSRSAQKCQICILGWGG